MKKKSSKKPTVNMTVDVQQHSMLKFIQKYLYMGDIPLHEVLNRCLLSGLSNYYHKELLADSLCLVLKSYAKEIVGHETENINEIVVELTCDFLKRRRDKGEADKWEYEVYGDSKGKEIKAMHNLSQVKML